MKEQGPTRFSFGKINYKILLIGIGVIALGFILMSGGSDDPNVYSDAILILEEFVSLQQPF
jgi:hypothetical protein